MVGSTQRGEPRLLMRIGFILGIAGGVVAVLGTFVPINGSFDTSAFWGSAGWGALSVRLLQVILLWTGPTVLVGVSIGGLRGVHPDRWVFALMAASCVLMMEPLSRLIPLIEGRGLPYLSLWVTYAGIALAFAGGITAVRARRSDTAHEAPDAAAPPGASVLGPLVVITGGAIYVIATFLPYSRYVLPGSGRVTRSMFDWVQGGTLIGTVAVTLLIYGPAAVVIAVAIAGRKGRGTRRWSSAVLAATAVWGIPALTMLALALLQRTILPHFLVGYWGAQLGPTIALAGGLVTVGRGREMRGVEPQPVAVLS